MAIKLDLSKAYDRVEWEFLRAILIKMGFPSNWVSLIMDCVCSSSLSFLLNGQAVFRLTPSRGLRQGCPLSPFLFLLCTEALSSLFQSSENNGRVLGLKCSTGGPFISHLFFTDDSIVFCKASTLSCSRIRDILSVYEQGSGQQLNFQKSMVTFSPSVDSQLREDLVSILGINLGNTHDKYLGLPSLIGRNKPVLFNEIRERLWKRIRGWKSNLFSFGGKEILIKVVAQAVPSYAMSIFRLPSSLVKELTAMVSKIWWGSHEGRRKISCLNWDILCLPKQVGGMGFRDLAVFNQALLANQAWRILRNPTTLAA
ncbi:hypothetical protein LWI29_027074 [Acer saccharum]|uniref:Reverse transcriptase domain-containing protein n=1 Tax=Acer saccharum TaxID=4024 RepID=A0AA39RNK0_ACESA|nr:hypothetical protein LWI29_027074 [Acer saccharum]